MAQSYYTFTKDYTFTVNGKEQVAKAGSTYAYSTKSLSDPNSSVYKAIEAGALSLSDAEGNLIQQESSDITWNFPNPEYGTSTSSLDATNQAIADSIANNPDIFGGATGTVDATTGEPLSTEQAIAETTNQNIDLMGQLTQAFNDSLRASSAASAELQRQIVNQSIASNQLATRLNQDLTSAINNSTQAQQQSSQALQNAITGLSSGAKGAQTGLEATDVSEAMAKQDAARLNLKRQKGGSEASKQAGMLSTKALLSKPTLLGI